MLSVDFKLNRLCFSNVTLIVFTMRVNYFPIAYDSSGPTLLTNPPLVNTQP